MYGQLTGEDHDGEFPCRSFKNRLQGARRYGSDIPMQFCIQNAKLHGPGADKPYMTQWQGNPALPGLTGVDPRLHGGAGFVRWLQNKVLRVS